MAKLMTSATCFVCAFLALLLGAAGTASGGGPGPLEQVRENTDKILAILKDPALKTPAKKAERRKRAENAADERFAWADMAQRSLGIHWAKRTEAEKREFVELYTLLARDTYLTKLDLFANESVRTVRQTVVGDYARVSVEITAEKTLDIAAVYYLRKWDGQWLVYDVAIDGVRLVLNTRAEFSDLLGTVSFPGFMAKLHAKCAALAEPTAVPTGRIARAGRMWAGGTGPTWPERRDPFVGAGAGEEPIPPVADPVEPMNRTFYNVDEALYAWVVKPAAKGYRSAVPKTVRGGFYNFFSNLGAPHRAICCLLQTDLKGAGTELARFGVNTTVGILGFRDPARTWLELKTRDADFGQTFGVWGMGPGWYLYWPLIGPSCGRGTLGLPFDLLLDPVEYLPGLDLVQEINETSLDLEEIESVLRAALDPYVAIRDAYHQHARYAIQKQE